MLFEYWHNKFKEVQIKLDSLNATGMNIYPWYFEKVEQWHTAAAYLHLISKEAPLTRANYEHVWEYLKQAARVELLLELPESFIAIGERVEKLHDAIARINQVNPNLVTHLDTTPWPGEIQKCLIAAWLTPCRKAQRAPRIQQDSHSSSIKSELASLPL